ncbi:MAG: hypothetical protein GXP15_12225 [Gammaproteobacteria bacterium]|nr:hypothetical protein [Gammaproteobacteria bacterium]
MPDFRRPTTFFIIGMALICALPIACSETAESPEEAVRNWLADGELAVESKDRRALVDMVSANYADARGNERKDIGDMMRLYFLRRQKVAVLTKIDQITLHGDTAAEVLLIIGLAGTNAATVGLSADAFRFELELEYDGDDWLLIGARWGEIGKKLR